MTIFLILAGIIFISIYHMMGLGSLIGLVSFASSLNFTYKGKKLMKYIVIAMAIFGTPLLYLFCKGYREIIHSYNMEVNNE